MLVEPLSVTTDLPKLPLVESHCSGVYLSARMSFQRWLFYLSRSPEDPAHKQASVCILTLSQGLMVHFQRYQGGEFA